MQIDLRQMQTLFDDSLIPGLTLHANFIDAAEERELIDRIDAQPMEPFRFQQWTGKRLVKSFGWHYDFQLGTVSRAEPIPEWLDAVRARAAALAGFDSHALQQALLLKYGPGAGINWHRDRPQFGEVFGISLGTFAQMRFRRRVDQRWQRMSVPLEPRSLYHLSGEVRHEWEHSIVEMPAGSRYSITFRTLSESGRKRTAAL